MVASLLLRVRAHGFMWALCAALIFLAGWAEVARAAQTTAPATQVQVWNVNTHGMAIGGSTAPDNSDYRNFVTYITNGTRAPYVPDVVTLQEAGASGDRASCHEFASRLYDATNRTHTYDCRETGMQGGSAVVYRTDRFTLEAWTPVTEKIRAATNGPCNDSPSWRSIAVRIRDTNLKRISVGSFHFPKSSNTDADCAWDNMQGLDAALTSADMKIAAGDTNHADAITSDANHNTYSTWEYWYQHSNLRTSPSPCASPNLCWKDVMYQKWANAFANAGLTPTPADLYGYMHAYEWSWSHVGLVPSPSNTDRRDYIWTKPQAVAVAFDSTNQPRTVPWADAGSVPYSDHRGQGALLSYP